MPSGWPSCGGVKGRQGKGKDPEVKDQSKGQTHGGHVSQCITHLRTMGLWLRCHINQDTPFVEGSELGVAPSQNACQRCSSDGGIGEDRPETEKR